jgi:hypothetical protein
LKSIRISFFHIFLCFFFSSSFFIFFFFCMSTNNLTTDGQLNLSGDTHGSLYKVIGVTLAIASGILIDCIINPSFN